MGTRSNTFVFNGTVKLVNMYRQFDGYPSGHGAELAGFLAPLRLVNGLIDNSRTIANGAGCLAAQMIAHFKTEPGGIYIDNPDGECNNDYTYEIHTVPRNPESGISIVVRQFDAIIFNGTVQEFIKFCAESHD